MSTKVAYVIKKPKDDAEPLSLIDEEKLKNAILRAVSHAKSVHFRDGRVRLYDEHSQKVVEVASRICTITLHGKNRVSRITAQGIVSRLRRLPPCACMQHLPSHIIAS